MGQEKNYSVTYHHLAEREARQLDAFWRDEVLSAIEGRLFVRPDFYGKPLRQVLKGCWALRVGDYRVVYQIEKKVVRVVAIVHRSTKYRGIQKRV